MIINDILTLLMLILLQAVLGIDNLLYISLESKNAPLEKQAFVRKIGIGLAIVFRILLLFILVKVGIQPVSMQTIKAILLGFFVLGIHFALPTVACFFEETHFMYYILDGFFRTTIIGGLYIGFMLYLNLSPDITALVSKNVKKIRGKLG